MKIKSILLFLSLTFLFAACQVDRTIHPISEKNSYRIKGYKNLSPKNKIKIAKDGEPGERLIICGKVIWKDDKRPVKNQLIHFYQTDANGDYQSARPDDESTARLNGNVFTNDLGMFYLETILPGDYGNSTDNRHIHTTVYGTKPEEYDLHFSQYTGYMGRRSIEKSDQHFLVNLEKDNDGKLIGFVTMEVRAK